VVGWALTNLPVDPRYELTAATIVMTTMRMTNSLFMFRRSLTTKPGEELRHYSSNFLPRPISGYATRLTLNLTAS
jgi:hypothetical protein